MNPLTPATQELLRPLRNLTDNDRLSLKLDEHNNFIAHFYAHAHYDAKRIVYPSYIVERNFIQRFPERKRLEGKGVGVTFQLAGTDYSAAIIDNVWPKSQIQYSPEAFTYLKYLLLTVKQQENAALKTAHWNEIKNANSELFHPVNVLAIGHSPNIVNTNYLLRRDRPLSLYQKVALHNVMQSEGYGLFMEQGTGKTPVIVSAICNAARNRPDKSKMFTACVVCPNNVRSNWLAEFHAFATVGGKVTILRGDAITRMKQLIDAFTPEDNCEFTVVVLGYDSLATTWDGLSMIDWDLSVLDESHYIKSPKTKRFKYALKLRDKSKKRVVLTGTPVANTPLDIYAQFEFMGKGWSGFATWKGFREFYGVYDNTADGQNQLVAMANLPFMKERLTRLSFQVKKKEALPDLPPKLYDIVEVELTQKQQDAYRQLLTSLIVQSENELNHSENRQLTVNNILTRLLRLTQITSGFIKWDEVLNPDTGEVIRPAIIEPFDPNPKLNELLEIVKEKGNNDKTIVWCSFVQDIQTISAALHKLGIDNVTYYGQTNFNARELAERRFNLDPSLKWFIGHPGAGGTGLNLLGYDKNAPDEYETNCNHIIYYSQDWSSLKRAQSEDRGNRRGTREPTRITDLCATGTIDEEIRRRVLEKRQMANELSDIREILHNIMELIG